MKAIVKFLLVCHPTGYGKSLCFALLPLVYDYLREVKGSIVVCISPLTALMMEQKTKYRHQGLVLEFSGELQHDNIQSICNVRERIVQLIYVSPESILRNLQWRDMLRKNLITLFIVTIITLEMKPLIRIFTFQFPCAATCPQTLSFLPRIIRGKGLGPRLCHAGVCSGVHSRELTSLKRLLEQLSAYNDSLYCPSSYKRQRRRTFIQEERSRCY